MITEVLDVEPRVSHRRWILMSRLDQLERRVATLEGNSEARSQRIHDLQQHSAIMEEETRRAEQIWLLGQATHTMSQLTEDFVFGEEDTGSLIPLSLKQMYARHKKQELTTGQRQRWNLLQVLLTENTAISPLIQVDKYLRTFGRIEADPSQKQIDSTTMHQLLAWADAHLEERVLLPVKGYLKLVNRFSSRNMPLCPDIQVEELLLQPVLKRCRLSIDDQ